MLERDSLCQSIVVWKLIRLENLRMKHMDNVDVIHRVLENKQSHRDLQYNYKTHQTYIK